MATTRFEVQAPFQPAGDQPKAIAELTAGLTQIPYDPKWFWLGNDGGHIGNLSRRWSCDVLSHEIDPSLPKKGKS